MKKPIKLTLFNITFIIIAILGFSNRGLGLGFNLSNGALKFALSISLSLFGIFLFFYVNYLIVTQIEKIDFKVDKLNTIDDCISALYKCKKSDPSFLEEISKAIEQLNTLKRRKEALTTLLEQNNALESFNYLNDTADKANSYVFSNIKKIINRLIAFDNEEYLSDKTSYDIKSHQNYIHAVLEDNKNILKEYNSLLIAFSAIGDTSKTDLDEIRIMTEALNHVLQRSMSNNNVYKEDINYE